MNANLLLSLGLIVGGLAACASQAEPDGADQADTGVQARAALGAFDIVYEVLQHPRCMNCHPNGDRPLQFDESLPHTMNVVRGSDDRGFPGMRCEACHGRDNLALAHTPPGVSTGWRLAPREMQFEGLSKAELAWMLLDPERSHMSPDELVEHVEHDPLVQWGWNPGPNRTPVPIAHVDFVAAFKTWVAGGAPIPEEGR